MTGAMSALDMGRTATADRDTLMTMDTRLTVTDFKIRTRQNLNLTPRFRWAVVPVCRGFAMFKRSAWS